jgi:prepilin-type processing-associated H-X9-DG protein
VWGGLGFNYLVNGQSLASIQSPAQCFQFMDSARLTSAGYTNNYLPDPDKYEVYRTTYQDGFSGWSRYPIDGSLPSDAAVPMARHNNTCNVCYFDGHVKSVRLSSVWIHAGEDQNNYWNVDERGKAYNYTR